MSWIREKIARWSLSSAERKRSDMAKARTRERWLAALHYNRIYYWGMNPDRTNEKRPGRWMCPKCNSIKKQTDFCFLGGRVFEACCEWAEGPRFGKDAALDDTSPENLYEF